jgi:hypothetical protein
MHLGLAVLAAAWTFWLSVGPGQGDSYELYYDESRPALYENFNWKQPRK